MITDKQRGLLQLYSEIFREKGTHPTRSDFLSRGVSRDQIRHHFVSLTALKNEWLLQEGLGVEENDVSDHSVAKEEITENIVRVYKKLLLDNSAHPTVQQIVSQGITREELILAFGEKFDVFTIKQYMLDNYGGYVDSVLYTSEDFFRSAMDRQAPSDSRRFIITTAVAGSPADMNFIASMRLYAKYNDATIVIMPCESVTNSFENKTASFDPVFRDTDFYYINRDVSLNENLTLCSIQISAKQIKPTTGLARLGSRNGSNIFASPKQFLDYQPCGNSRSDNYSIMTTGACTQPSYYSEIFVSKRLSYIAERDHTIGAIIVELCDDGTFHFRHIQADENGAFIDLGVEYDGRKVGLRKVPVNIIFGDIHSAQVDKEVLNAAIDTVVGMDIKRVFLHDVFDGLSINHHVTTIGGQASRHISGNSNLIDELLETYDVINHIDKRLCPDHIDIVKSNHDEVIDRYLTEGRYIYDPENHYTALKIATAPFEGEDPLKRGMEVAGKVVPSNWTFHDRQTSVKIAGVECAAHGDLGSNGSRGSMAGFEMIYGDCVIGHAHTAAILRGVFRVGTMSKMDMGYNRGPSSWTHTFCMLYENGQRQLINVINNKTNNPEGRVVL